MPDPRDPTPVRAVRRGGGWVVLDAGGHELAGQSSGSEQDAEDLAARVNATWSAAKSERKSKGAPATTREARVAARAAVFGRILGL